MGKTCYIFGAGEYEGTTFPTISDGDLVIAADGGLSVLQQQGIAPNIIIGDFDSYPAELPQIEGVDILRYPVEKDDTDMLLAAKYGLEKGCQCFHLYGGMGGRLDHTLANIQLLAWLSHQGAQGFLYGNHTVLTAITNSTITFAGDGIPGDGFPKVSTAADATTPTQVASKPAPHTHLSVFCYGEKAEGVTIKGCKYTAENATWTNQYPIGVSNVFTGAPAEVTVTNGTLLLYWEVAE